MHVHQPSARHLRLVADHPMSEATRVQTRVSAAELRLSERATSAGLAREFVRTTLTSWKSTVDIDDAVLVVSELVTNVLLHAHGAPLVRLLSLVDGVRVEVCDDSPQPPLRSRGLGLALVEGLATSWGSSPRGCGKVVWCDLPATPRAATAETASA